MLELQQTLQTELDEECLRIVEATSRLTAPRVVEGDVRRTATSFVAKEDGEHVKRQPTDVLAASEQLAFEAGLLDLIESVQERRLRTLAVSGAALGDLGARPTDRRP